jgi:hypothetical protein
MLLEELTHVQPSKRPSIQKVVQKSANIYVCDEFRYILYSIADRIP